MTKDPEAEKTSELFFAKEWTGECFVKEFNERSHEKCCNDGSDTCKGRNHGYLTARKKEENTSDNDTAKVTSDTTEFKRSYFPFF